MLLISNQPELIIKMKTNIFLVFVLSLLLITCNNISEQKNQTNKAGENLAELRVAAYNVEVSKNATAREIGEALKKYNFDIIGFSEAPGGEWTKQVAEQMNMEYVIVGQYSTAGHEDKYKTIASKTPLYDYEEVFMNDTLHTVTKAKTKIKDREIAFYSVHFPFGWRDQAHIDETTGKISSYVNYLKERQTDEITIAVGDFNFIPSNDRSESMYHEMFKNIGLDFSWNDLDMDFGKQNTHNAFEPGDAGNGNVIDHILYNPDKVKALDGSIVEMNKPLSDHKPVWALLQIKP